MLNPGDQIADWIVVKPLGEGGMGSVFECKNALSDRIRAAVKIIKPHGLDATERFIREAEALYALRHPSIVRVTGFGEDKDRKLLWLAMELVDGEDLSKHLAHAPLAPSKAKPLFRQYAKGLEHAHTRGIFHRDIKPANLTLNPQGEGVILDFGIAISSGRTKLTQEGLVPGTLQYMPPEVFEGELSVPEKTDIYSLGIVLYEALVGTPAFEEDPNSSDSHQMVRMMSMKLNSKRFDPGREFPNALRNAISMATEPDPNQRLSNMTDFVRLLNDETLATSPFSANPSTAVSTPSSKAKWWVGGFMVTLTMVLIVAIVGIGVIAALLSSSASKDSISSADIGTSFNALCAAGPEHNHDDVWHTIQMIKKVSGTDSCDHAQLQLEHERGVDLSGLKITTLSPLEGTQPIHLRLNNNQITDISALTSLAQLRHLAMNNNQLRDLTPLTELKQLETVSLDNNQIKDLSPIQSLSGLKELRLRNNQIRDISALRSLEKLTTLTLDENLIARTHCPIDADTAKIVRAYCLEHFTVKKEEKRSKAKQKNDDGVETSAPPQEKTPQIESVKTPPSNGLTDLSEHFIQKISEAEQNVIKDQKTKIVSAPVFTTPDCSLSKNQSPNSYKSLLSWAKGKMNQAKQSYNKGYHCGQAEGLASQAYCKDKAALPLLKEIHEICSSQ